MKVPLKILMVFPEIAPFSRTGSVGDVGNSLPRALKDLGHDVRLITPQYRTINERKYIIRDVIRLQSIPFEFGNEKVAIDVRSAFLPGSKVQVYFIDYKPYFFREGLYRENGNGKPYADNDRRFLLFSKGILETLLKLQWQPDIIHCHDWQTGLIPYFLRTTYKSDLFFQSIATILSIYQIEDQGKFDPSCLSLLHMDKPLVLSEPDKKDRQCVFLKTGISYADQVSLRDLPDGTTPRNQWLEEMLRERKSRVTVIRDGVDYDEWNPETDSHLAGTYSRQNLDGKQKNRETLMRRVGLTPSEMPLVVLSRQSVDDRGYAVVRDVFHEIMHQDVCFLLFGCETKNEESFFLKAGTQYRDRVAVCSSKDAEMIHLMESGADIQLFPSALESPDLSPLIALKYGCIPVYGDDAVDLKSSHPFEAKSGRGVGFRFTENEGKALVKSLSAAVKSFQNPRLRSQLIKNSMQKDFSWQAAAKKYLQLYSRCQSHKNK